jgi:hypothetical protein
LALRKVGISATVFERAPEIREVGGAQQPGIVALIQEAAALDPTIWT